MAFPTPPAPIRSPFGNVKAMVKDAATGKLVEKLVDLEMSPEWQRWFARLQYNVEQGSSTLINVLNQTLGIKVVEVVRAVAEITQMALFFGSLQKASNALTTAYLKNECILTSPLSAGAGKITLMAPTGNYDSYAGGWIARALIFKNGAGERALAKNILDLFVVIQNGDGSWYAQYNPFTNAAGTGYDKVTNLAGWFPLQISGFAASTSGDYKTEAAIASLIYAMADYDIAIPGTVYKVAVQAALDFMRILQTVPSSNLVSNSKFQGTINNVAILGNSALCLLAAIRALDAYGDALLTSGGFRVKRMINDIYYSLTLNGWAGDAANYYNATFPVGTNTIVPINPYKEKIAFTQSQCAWANFILKNGNTGFPAYWRAAGSGTCNIAVGGIVTQAGGSTWDFSQEGQSITINAVVYTVGTVNSEAIGGTLTVTPDPGNQVGVAFSYAGNSNNVYQAERALDFLLPLTTGEWGGQLYSPFLGLAQETTDEMAFGTALMALAMQAVNSTKYTRQIAGSQAALQWLALTGGQMYELVDPASGLWKWKTSAPGTAATWTTNDGYGFLSAPIAMGLLAGA